MNMVQQIIKWEHPKHHILVLFFRVILGIIITFKGVLFLSNSGFLGSLLHNSNLYKFSISFWFYYISLSSLLCGIFIITGLFVRIAVLLQIPVLIGAVLFINPGEHGFSLNGEFGLSLLVLVMLFYFLLKGPGEISMDNYLKNNEL